MPRMRTYRNEVDPALLGQALSATYTQSWSTIFTGCERVVYTLITHGSCDVEFNVQIASDSSGTGAADVATSITANVAGKIHTIEVAPGALTASKQYVSARVTRTAGTYTLLRQKFDLRRTSEVTADSTVGTQREAY